MCETRIEAEKKESEKNRLINFFFLILNDLIDCVYAKNGYSCGTRKQKRKNEKVIARLTYDQATKRWYERNINQPMGFNRLN